MTQGSLGIEDHEFWLDPLRTREDIEVRLVREGGEHTLLDAPTAVELAPDRRTLPAVVLHVAPHTAGALPFMEHAVLAATQPATNHTTATALLPHDPDRLTLRTDGFDLPPPQGTVTSAAILDIAAQLGVPLDRPGAVVLRLFLRDRLLAVARILLRERPALHHDPEVARYLEEQARRPRPAPVWPPARRPLPSYEPTPDSPPLPDAPGITLRAPRIVPIPESRSDRIQASVPVVLHGSFRLPIRPRDRTPPAPEALLSRHPTAVVPISLLLIGGEYAAPHVFRLAVPSFDPLTGDPGAPIATGHFTLDLGALVNLAGVPQTYFLHALSGEHISPPAITALVAPP